MVLIERLEQHELEEVYTHVVFAHLTVKKLKVSRVNLLEIYCKNTCGDLMRFVLTGEKIIKVFMKKFSIGDSVNIVSLGDYIVRISKGIDVEV